MWKISIEKDHENYMTKYMQVKEINCYQGIYKFERKF